MCRVKKIFFKHNSSEIPLHTFNSGQNLEHWPHRMLKQRRNNWNSCLLLVRMKNGTATLEDHLAVSYILFLTIQSSNCTPWYLPKESENLGPPGKKLHTSVFFCMYLFIATLIIIAQTWDQPKCPSVGEWTNKAWWKLPRDKKKWAIKPSADVEEP